MERGAWSVEGDSFAFYLQVALLTSPCGSAQQARKSNIKFPTWSNGVSSWTPSVPYLSVLIAPIVNWPSLLKSIGTPSQIPLLSSTFRSSIVANIPCPNTPLGPVPESRGSSF